ncbi:adenosine kinase [Estrella lausannensis]|uniref:Carbohydrate kinase n=1 Tax=Estrella lausannensis TaxID=483423 RepID=A0A0H5E629_9BACT|nr:adenosine kinase [Estrella lausannensis]CRX38710.1 Carbohydrate kinase [Estrella lausannensis]
MSKHSLLTKFVLSCLLLITTAYGKESTNVLGVGAAIVDYLIEVEDDYLFTISGSKGGCELIDYKNFKKILHDNQDRPIRTATGGSGANTVKGLARLNIQSALLGKIGHDEEGMFFLNRVVQMGVIPMLIPCNLQTQQVICLITPDKQRTMRCYLGAGGQFKEADLNKGFFLGFNHVHIEGYALRNGKLVEESLKMAKECGCTTSFDLGCYELAEEFKERILERVLPLVDIVFANKDESFHLTGKFPKAACEDLLAICPTAVVLVGKDGCYVGEKGIVKHCPTNAVSMLDSTGAGDLFASGFLYGYLKGYEGTLSARIGNFLGGSVVQVIGAEIPDERWPGIIREINRIESEGHSLFR